MNNHRYLYFWLSRIIGRILPILYLVNKYGIFKNDTPPKLRLTGIAIFIIFIVVIAFYKDFLKWLKTLNNDMKYLSKTTKAPLLAWLMVLVLLWARNGVYELFDVVLVAAICMTIAIPFSNRHLKSIEKKEDTK